jgi:hypothetical protein
VRTEWVDHRVHPALRGFVATAVGYRQEGLAPGLHRGLPSPYLTFVVTLDEPLVLLAHPDPGQAPGRYDGLVGGLHTRPALIEHPGRQAGLQLSLTPAGARTLLGVPAGALASLDAPVDDVLGAPGRELVDRVRSAPDWRSRFAAVEQVLLRSARQDSAPAPEVAEAWRRSGSVPRPACPPRRPPGWSASTGPGGSWRPGPVLGTWPDSPPTWASPTRRT